MLRLRAVRVLSAVALAGAATLGGFVFAGPASAVTQIKCTHLSGNINTTSTLTGCSGNTGGASQPFTSTSLATGGTITWVNGLTTTVTLTVTTTETDSDTGGTCPAGTTEYQAKGKVTADTTGSAPVGGVAKGEACVNSSTGSLTNEPGSALKLK